jgi:gluconolactonase
MTNFRIFGERFRALIDESQNFETLGEGFRFTGGATWHPKERHVTFSDIPSSRIHRWHPARGEMETLRDPSNMTNGMTYDREGRRA